MFSWTRAPMGQPHDGTSLLRTSTLILAHIVGFLALAGCATPRSAEACNPKVATILEGLTEPRGLTFGPDGSLYVAETGTIESGGRVVRMDSGGAVSTFSSGFSVFLHSLEERVGISGLAFRGDDLYAVLGEGLKTPASALVLIKRDDGPRVVADLLGFARSRHPLGSIAPNPSPPIVSNPFAIVHVTNRDVFYVVDSGANYIVSISPDGQIEQVHAWDNNPVPTGISIGPEGKFYVALFSPIPYTIGNGSVVELAPDGSVTTVVAGLTTPIGIAFDSQKTMYVLEFSQGFDSARSELFTPNTGRLLRISDDERQVLLDGLEFPTALFITPGDEIYISHRGGISSPGTGEVIRAELCQS